MKRTYRDQTPREIIARFDGVCRETGKPIKAGDRCVYYPQGKSIFSLDSKQASTFRSEAFDREWLGHDY